MSVTILLVNYNSGGLLADCLSSLMAQTIRPDEILVVDNASVDGSAASLPTYDNVKVDRLDENLGFAAANNHGIAKCRTDYVALLNPDAFPDPDWLAQLIKAANSEPETTAFGSLQINHARPDILDGTGDSYHLTGRVWREDFGRHYRPGTLCRKEIFSPCAAAALYRRQALLEVGRFDEDYFCYVEDVDLGFRLRLAGHKSLLVPEAVVRHIGSATTGGSRSDFAVYHGHRNLVWVYVKNMPGILFWVLLPLHLLMNLVAVLRFSFRGQGGVILRAKQDAIKGLPAMWRKRRKIQSARTGSVLDIWRSLDKRVIPRIMRGTGK